MKILFIDNGTLHTDDLLGIMDGHNVTYRSYSPAERISDKGYQLIILSGGSIHNPYDISTNYAYWYDHELELIRRTSVPLIGICLGFELVCMAFGERLGLLHQKAYGKRKIMITPSGRELFGAPEIFAHEAHSWAIESVNRENFKVLARSSTGIEAVQHKQRPVLAMQFHPEATPKNSHWLKQLILEAPELAA